MHPLFYWKEVHMITGRDVVIYFAVKYAGDWSKIYESMKNRESFQDADVIATIAGLKCKVVTIIDNEYPQGLKKIYKPPFALFYYGDLNLLSNPDVCLSVVGSHDPSLYGIEMTQSITKGLSKANYTIVSGIAEGISEIAHSAAIGVGGKTIGISACGIDVCHPKELTDLYNTIKNGHLLVSEYPGITPVAKDNFEWRNRLIAAASKALVVTEAKKEGGTLVTVGYTLYLGREVYVVPHAVSKTLCNNSLIRDGACLVESADDILFDIKGKLPDEKTDH